MALTDVTFYNSLAIALEFIAVIALWVWLFKKFISLGRYFDAETHIDELMEEDPNEDLKRSRRTIISTSSGMLPVIAALASLDVLFSKTVVSYFTLFPLIISLISYYTATTGTLESFKFAGPRKIMIKHMTVATVIADDNKARKRLLRSFVNKYRFQIVGHLNFVVATLSFITGTVVSRSFQLTSLDLAYVMFHATLISYTIAFSAEVLLFKHRLSPPDK